MHAAKLRGLLNKLDARIPDRIPPIHGAAFQLCRILWVLTFIAAVVNPLMGLYSRYKAPTQNSWLLPGSRAGIAVSPDDATHVRFTVGPYTPQAGIRSGDDIVEVAGIPTPQSMPITEEALVEKANDPAYAAMTNLLFGQEPVRTPLTLASTDGSRRKVLITTGEHHIDAAARQIALSPKALSFIDVTPALAYPILLWVALLLYARNPDKPVPVLLSFSIMVLTAVEQPASTFIHDLGISRALNVALFDVANIMLLAAVLLFPDARLRPRRILLPLLMAPVLLFLQGTLYQAVFTISLLVAFTVFTKRLRTETGVKKQQLKLLFFGLALYPLFRIISIAFDIIKLNSLSFTGQLLLEFGAAVSVALASVSLVVLLFSALRSHRLYDADGLFTRSAMVAAITLTITGFFAITSAILESTAESLFGQAAGPWPSLVAAAAAVLLIKPAQRRIHDWSERRFQRGLFELRTELPKRMDDLRETATASSLCQEALSHIVTALRATRAAAIVDGKVSASIGISGSDLRNWLATENQFPANGVQCDRSDAMLPLRLALNLGNCPSSIGYIFLGPRPDGSIYSRDERKVLHEIAEPVARAVDVARQRQRAADADRRWKLRQEKRVRNLEQQLMAFIAGAGVKPAEN